MITFNSLKQTINRSLAFTSFENSKPEDLNINKIITGVLVLFTLNDLIFKKELLKSSVGELSNEYVKTYKNIIESMSRTFISYKKMKTYIVNQNLTNFIQITPTHANKIKEIYSIKEKIEKFSLITYSQKMYNLINIPDKDNRKLANAHKNIICPIVSYYRKIKDITLLDVYVEAEETSPIKIIYLSINGIDTNNIFLNISKDYFGIEKFLYSYSITDNDLLKLVIK